MSWPRDGQPRYMPDAWPTGQGNWRAVVFDRAYCWRPVRTFETKGICAAAAAAAAAAARLNASGA